MKEFLSLIICSLFLQSCKSNDGTAEVYQNNRKNVVSVKSQVKEIIGDDVLIGGSARLDILDQYLVISDIKSKDTLYHVFDKTKYQHLNSVGLLGPGPNEITNPAPIFVDEEHRNIHIPDLGKNKVLSFQIDSIVDKSFRCLPKVEASIDNNTFPDRILYFSDTLCVVRCITLPSNSSEYFKHGLARWNMKTGKMSPLSYSHPDIERKRIVFNASKESDVIVEAYIHHDLMTIYDFEGNFKRNIYGPEWDDATKNDMIYFKHIMIFRNKIIASYAGGRNWTDEQYPTGFMIFDLEGNYIKTLDVGYKIEHCCLDEENQRIVLSMNAEIQFGYLDIKDLI